MTVLVALVFYGVGAAILYGVIYYAVLNALRQHDEDRHRTSG